MLTGLLLAGCLGTQTDPPTPAPTVPPTHAVPIATETPIGEAEPAPLEESILMLRRARDGAVLGAAIVVTADGFLLTTAVTGTDGVEIVTPDGTALRPVQVARDDATGLTLLKIPVSGLAPVRLRRDAPPAGDSVVAVGYDAARGAFAQAGGHVTAPGAATATPGTEPTPLQTDIPLVEGFAGGALADPAGAVLGIIVPAVDSNGSRVSAALPAAYLAEWFEQWRAAQRAAVDESAGWPVLDAAGALTLRYPEGWSIAQASGGERDYRAEIVPNDPDVPLRLSVSIEGAANPGDPLGFARAEFGERRDATIWGTVEYGGMPGVRVILNQEGARVDVVYLFHDNRRIALSLTSGYGPGVDDPRSDRAEALFEAVLRSIARPRRPVG